MIIRHTQQLMTKDMGAPDGQLFLCGLLLLALAIPSTFGQCSTSNTHSPEPNCIDIFNVLQDALLNNTYNAFQLQSIYYPSSHITPSLVRVNFTLNDTAGSTEQHHVCNCTRRNPCTLAWTVRSLYQSFHPAVLNQLQFQLPFVVMRFTAEVLSDEPDLDTFLWDGTSKLPTVLLNLTIDSSTLRSDLQHSLQSCERNGTVRNALGEITKWVRQAHAINQSGINYFYSIYFCDCM